MPEPSKVAVSPEIERLVTSPRTAINVNGSNRDDPAIRQLNSPFTCTGPFAAVAGVTQAATTTRTRSSRLMSPLLISDAATCPGLSSPPDLARGDRVTLELRGRRYKSRPDPRSNRRRPEAELLDLMRVGDRGATGRKPAFRRRTASLEAVLHWFRRSFREASVARGAIRAVARCRSRHQA